MRYCSKENGCSYCNGVRRRARKENLAIIILVSIVLLIMMAALASFAQAAGLESWAKGMNQRAVSEEFPTAYVMLPANMIGNEFPWTLEAKCEKTRVFTDVELECRVIGTIKGEKP